MPFTATLTALERHERLMTGRETQQLLTDLLEAMGWLWVHFRALQNRRGFWQVPVEGPLGTGWPDVFAIQPFAGRALGFEAARRPSAPRAQGLVTGCSIHGFTYAGIGLLSTNSPVIEHNHIHHIGPGANAYGIFASSDDGKTVGFDGWLTDNLIEDIPTWQGINVHAASNLLIRGNIVRRVRRAYWFASASPRIWGLTVQDNRAEQPLTTVGGDTQPYFVSETDNCTFDGNSMSPDWAAATTPDGGEFVSHIRDYENKSTGLVRTGTVVV